MDKEREEGEAQQTERFLTFYLGEEYYGVSIFAVKEIIALMKTTRVPKAPDYLRGVMNLRGIIIPVIDTRMRFKMALREPDMHTDHYHPGRKRPDRVHRGSGRRGVYGYPRSVQRAPGVWGSN